MPCAATHLECHVHHHAHVLARVSTVGVAGRQVEKVGTCQVGDGLCSNGSSSGIVTFSIIRMFNRALLTNEGTCKCRQPGVRMQPYSIHFALRQQTETLPSGVYKADEIKPELTSQCFIAVYYKPKCIQWACCIDPKNYPASMPHEALCLEAKFLEIGHQPLQWLHKVTRVEFF